MKRFFSIILLIQAGCVLGQPPVYKASIRLLAKSYGDSIVLRWAPTTAWAWISLNKTGYRIERIDITDPKKPKRQVLTPEGIKPLTLDQFKQHFDRNNKYAAAAAQCLYGKNFTNHLRKSYGGIQDQSSVFTDRYSFAMLVADFDAGVAQAEGLRITDKAVNRNGSYVYRIYPAAATSPAKVDTGGLFIQNDGKLLLSKPVLTTLIGGDRICELHWNRYQKEIYSGYIIERSGDGRNYDPLNKNPFFAGQPDSMMIKKDTTLKRLYGLLKVQQVFVDSLPRNYIKYSYRIKGINAFGEWSPYSDTLIAQGRDLTPPLPVSMANPKFIGGKKIALKWKKTVKEPDFKGLVVSRSHNNVNGPYEVITDKLLDPSTVQFTDTSAFIHGQNFYLVVTVDTAGNMGASAPAMGLVPDKTPPDPPTGLKGTIEKNGRVHLSWDRNKEEDMKGYKVYYANSPEHVFSQITVSPYPDTLFVDSISLKNLTRNIWYKIVAVDENNNHSEYSAPVKLRKPDIVPPVPPLASRVQADTGGVQIDWIQSASEDAAAYIIYRKEKDKAWFPVSRVKHDSTKKSFHFTDAVLTPFVTYSYCAETIDEDSLHSAKSTAVTASVKTIRDLPVVATLTAVYDEKAKEAHLHWQYKNTGSYFFVLYRSAGHDPLIKWRSTGSGMDQFTDHVAQPPGTVIQYAIQVLFNDERGKTKLSDPVRIVMP